MNFKEFYDRKDPTEIIEAKTPKIYCDMDGVLCDFDKGIFDIDGKTHIEDLEEGHPSLDMWKHIEKGGGSEKFYSNLEWHPQGKALFQHLLKLPNVEILTSLGRSNPDKEASKKGKQNWLEKNNITFPQNFSQKAADKQKWAKGNILIDDYEPNITQWNEAGGKAIHFKTAEQAIKELKALTENIVVAPYVIVPDDTTMIDPK